MRHALQPAPAATVTLPLLLGRQGALVRPPSGFHGSVQVVAPDGVAVAFLTNAGPLSVAGLISGGPGTYVGPSPTTPFDDFTVVVLAASLLDVTNVTVTFVPV
jgi:hypothetical protein